MSGTERLSSAQFAGRKSKIEGSDFVPLAPACRVLFHHFLCVIHSPEDEGEYCGGILWRNTAVVKRPLAFLFTLPEKVGGGGGEGFGGGNGGEGGDGGGEGGGGG